MKNKITFAQNLKIARNLLGLSLQKLADAIGVSKQAISQYEKGAMFPNSTVLLKIAATLSQKVDFFFRPVTNNLTKIAFRKNNKLSLPKQKILAEKANIFLEKYVLIEQILGQEKDFFNPISTIQINKAEDAEAAANALREAWQLSIYPIHSVSQLLELQYIKIFEQAVFSEHEQNIFDGLSLILDNKIPLIFANTSSQIDVYRHRFTLLHELGHIFLNIPASATAKKIETYCNRFAAAMLLPAVILIEKLGRSRENIAIPELQALQESFGISLLSLIWRCADLNIITKTYAQVLKNTIIPFVANSSCVVEEKAHRFSDLVYKAVALELISMSKAAELLNVDLLEVRKNLNPNESSY